jgi:hypothetical protein
MANVRARRRRPQKRHSPPRPARSGRTTTRTMRVEPSPIWVPALMGIFFAAALLVVLLNYLSILPGSPSTSYQVLGGGSFLIAGLVMATRWR